MLDFTWTLLILVITSSGPNQLRSGGYETEQDCLTSGAVIKSEVEAQSDSMVFTKCRGPKGEQV